MTRHSRAGHVLQLLDLTLLSFYYAEITCNSPDYAKCPCDVFVAVHFK